MLICVWKVLFSNLCFLSLFLFPPLFSFLHSYHLSPTPPPPFSPVHNQVPHQLGALTFYRYEQPIVDYCQAHQPLRLNMGYEGPPQSLEGLEDLGPCDRGTIQTIALPAVPPGTSIGTAMPGPRSPPPPLRPPTEGPSGGPFPPTERTGTLKFGR